MAQKAEPGRRPVQRHKATPSTAAAEEMATGRARAGGPTEPGTAWALWPTFLRRTLAEDEMALRRAVPVRAE